MKMAIVVFRHGDRTPVNGLPRDPNVWSLGWGQLTPQGMARHYALGQAFRERYVDTYGLLNATYSRENIRIDSTDVDRTFQSAQSNLLGIYPEGPLKTSDGRNVQVFPIHSVAIQNDWLLRPWDNCPRYQEHRQTFYASEEYAAKVQENKDFIARMSQITGLDVQLSKWYELYDPLFVELQEGRKWLPGITMDDFNKILELDQWANLREFSGTDVARRLVGGNLLREVLFAMEQKAALASHRSVHSPNPNLWMLSAHDTTLMSLLSALNIYDGTVPPYASHFVFELWVDAAGTHSVTMRFNDQPVNVGSCHGVCQFDEFRAMIHQRWMPTYSDWKSLCLSTDVIVSSSSSSSLSESNERISASSSSSSPISMMWGESLFWGIIIVVAYSISVIAIVGLLGFRIYINMKQSKETTF